MSSFGVYFHIPYCLQRCTYCDFATYEKSQILPPEKYTTLVLQEMQAKRAFYPPRLLDTIYFGGGTPSLVEPQNILQMIEGLEKLGFRRSPETEITLEINPATLNVGKMESYLKMGINRFSVGAQTFDNSLLKKVRREHSAQQTEETLAFLKPYGVNYSFDLLFALPGQTREGLARDLERVLTFEPPHVSPYCLTVPAENPLSKGRPDDDQQVAMFEQIAGVLKAAGYQQYEISNFCRPGFESRHNQLYWQDQEWWGLGLSSHSYWKGSPWGLRFWNPRSIHDYETHVRGLSELESPLALSPALYEDLQRHQAMTDYCHTSLRTSDGLHFHKLRSKFDEQAEQEVRSRAEPLVKRGWLTPTETGFRLSEEGIVLSNQVFLEFTFLRPTAH
ncbi:MAG: radical SAM family heme chaperone HemW [Bdellovibrionales bacterium]